MVNLPFNQFAQKANSSLGKATEAQKLRIQEIGLPEDLETILTQRWLVDYGQIECLEIFDIQSICEEVNDEYIGKFSSVGYLAIGKAGNGDMLVLNFRKSNYPIGFIQLAVWDVDYPPDVNAYVRVSDSLSDFIARSISKRSLWAKITGRYNLPCDSYDS